MSYLREVEIYLDERFRSIDAIAHPMPFGHRFPRECKMKSNTALINSCILICISDTVDTTQVQCHMTRFTFPRKYENPR